VAGEAAARQEPPNVAAAEEAFRAGLDAVESLGLRPLAERCRLGLGRLYARIGRADDARAALTSAAEAFRAMGMDSDLATAERDLAELGGVPT
jgi:hypothetical protein